MSSPFGAAGPVNLLLLVACADKPVVPDAVVLAAPRLIPQPVRVEEGTGLYELDGDTRIDAGSGAEEVARLLAEALRPATGLPLEVGAGAIRLRLVGELPAEGYTLDVDATGVTIDASDTAGLFYGTQTLRQLLPPEVLAATPVEGVKWRIPAVHIEDAPRFEWRGAMIDVARHFFTVEDVERQIDLLALHKLNRLHLHLTDDQGWRLEILSWPALTQVGGSTEVGGGVGGWYTQAEYAGLVAYAAERFVTVVPEIDFPGHANAALASYGELNESGVPADLYTGAGVISTPLWLEGPETAGFVADVLHEVAALTSGEWLHVGGDEAVDVALEDYAAFVVTLQEITAADGKTLVGWDEIGEVELEAPFVAQHWYDADLARSAAARGGRIIASPAEYAYLDMMQDADADYGQVWAGVIDVEDAYAWDPVLEGLEEGDVLGVEGALWTEYIDTVEKLDFMVWPRLAAHAELGWSPTGEWDEFRERLAWHGGRLDALGVGYYRSPDVDW